MQKFINLGWFNYIQTLNNITTSNDRNNQSIGLVFKTAYRKWPDFSIGYTKDFSQMSGITKSNYKSDELNSELEFTFLKSFTYRAEYESMRNTNSSQSNSFEIINTSIRYQKKNSPFGFELFCNNLLDNKVKNSYSFSDYMISQQATYVLPRVIMLSINYKL